MNLWIRSLNEAPGNKHPLNVNFSHVNWAEANDHFKHSSFCWALLLNGLKNYLEDNYLENGIIIPFKKDRS